jgi:hypothetical protein
MQVVRRNDAVCPHNTKIERVVPPMNVRRIGFLATRTANYQPTADFFRDVLGLQTAWTKPDWAGEGFGWFFLRAPDGNIYCMEQVAE